MAKFWGEGSKELPINSKGEPSFSIFNFDYKLTCYEDINDSATLSRTGDAAAFGCYRFPGGCSAD